MSDTPRRAILAAVGAATGAIVGSGTATAQDGGTVTTRRCNDQSVQPGDWATGAVTAYACPRSSGGTVEVSVTGDVGIDRTRPPTGPQGTIWTVPPGERLTVWFTGTLIGLRCSDDALNIGVVNR